MNSFLQLPPEALVHVVDLTIPASGEWALTSTAASTVLPICTTKSCTTGTT